MSEYQYYEFRAVDRPLTRREMRKLRSLSTRAQITPTSFVNHYEWGNFKGDPQVLMEKYFDAHVYVANWGTHQLAFRIPRHALDFQAASACSTQQSLRVRKIEDFVILDFLFEDENRDWDDDDEGWMDSLIPLRADLMRGDLRCLYLGWLLCVQKAEVSKNEVEPSVPPGLRQLTAPLESLVRFAGLDRELIRAASERSSDWVAAPHRNPSWQHGSPPCLNARRTRCCWKSLRRDMRIPRLYCFTVSSSIWLRLDNGAKHRAQDAARSGSFLHPHECAPARECDGRPGARPPQKRGKRSARRPPA